MSDPVAPLSGVRVLVTRPQGQTQPFCEALQQAGATPVVLPLLCTEAVDVNPAEWDLVNAVDWVIFTSANGVNYGWESAPPHIRAALCHRARIATVGPATARAVTEQGGMVHLVAPEYVAESLVNALGDALGEVAGKRLLWIRGVEARDVLPEAFNAQGARMDEIIVYRSVPAPVSAEARLEVGVVDVVTLTSPSIVRQFVSLFGNTPSARVVCLGPITADAARACGLRVDAVANPYTIEGLMTAIVDLRLPVRRVA